MIRRQTNERLAFYAELKKLMEEDVLINENLIMKDNAKGDWYRCFDSNGFYKKYPNKDFVFECSTAPLDLTKTRCRPQLHLTFPDGDINKLKLVGRKLKNSITDVTFKVRQQNEEKRCTLIILRKLSNDPTVNTIEGEAQALASIIHNVLECLLDL